MAGDSLAYIPEVFMFSGPTDREHARCMKAVIGDQGYSTKY